MGGIVPLVTLPGRDSILMCMEWLLKNLSLLDSMQFSSTMKKL